MAEIERPQRSSEKSDRHREITEEWIDGIRKMDALARRRASAKLSSQLEQALRRLEKRKSQRAG